MIQKLFKSENKKILSDFSDNMIINVLNDN